MKKIVYFLANLALFAALGTAFVYGTNEVYENCSQTGYVKNEAPPFVVKAEPEKIKLKVFDMSLDIGLDDIWEGFLLATDEITRVR